MLHSVVNVSIYLVIANVTAVVVVVVAAAAAAADDDDIVVCTLTVL